MNRYFCWTFFFLSLFVRIVIIYVLPRSIQSDEVVYDGLARSILSGEGFSLNGRQTSFYPPLYAYVLSFLYYIGNHSLFFVKCVQALLVSLLVFPLYSIGKRLYNDQTAKLGCVFFVLYPSLLFISNKLLTETLFMFFFMMAIYFSSQNVMFSILSGLCLGLATLVRPLFLGAIVLGALSSVVMKKYKLTILFLCSMMTLLPWVLRNYVIHHEWVLMTTYNGYVLYNSIHPKDGKLFGFMSPHDETIGASWKLDSEVERSRFLMKAARKDILSHPFYYLKLGVMKILFFWVPFDWEVISHNGQSEFNLLYAFLFPFFIMAIGYMLNNRHTIHHIKEQFFILAVFSYVLFFCIFSYGSPRFRLPFEPLFILVSSSAIIYWLKKYPRRIVFGSVIYMLMLLYVAFNADGSKKILASSMSVLGLW